MDGALRLLASFNETQDKLFGPALQGPNVAFDFTISFERSILSILPSALFLVYAPLRAGRLWNEHKKARWSRLALGKQVSDYLHYFPACIDS
jgi:ATP-binding cassette subfamily C (CFTR/MRP) protein 1